MHFKKCRWNYTLIPCQRMKWKSEIKPTCLSPRVFCTRRSFKSLQAPLSLSLRPQPVPTLWPSLVLRSSLSVWERKTKGDLLTASCICCRFRERKGQVQNQNFCNKSWHLLPLLLEAWTPRVWTDLTLNIQGGRTLFFKFLQGHNQWAT